MSAWRRWALAFLGAGLITTLIVAVFLLGGMIGRELMAQACSDRGHVWNAEQAICEGYEP